MFIIRIAILTSLLVSHAFAGPERPQQRESTRDVVQDAAALVADDPAVYFEVRDRALAADIAARKALIARLQAPGASPRSKVVARVLQVRATNPALAIAFDRQLLESAANPIQTRLPEPLYNASWDKTSDEELALAVSFRRAWARPSAIDPLLAIVGSARVHYAERSVIAVYATFIPAADANVSRALRSFYESTLADLPLKDRATSTAKVLVGLGRLAHIHNVEQALIDLDTIKHSERVRILAETQQLPETLGSPQELVDQIGAEYRKYLEGGSSIDNVNRLYLLHYGAIVWDHIRLAESRDEMRRRSGLNADEE